MPGCTDCASDQAGEDLENPRFRSVLWIALLANFTMFLVEIIASHLGDSMSLQADALDFFDVPAATAAHVGGVFNRHKPSHRGVRGVFWIDVF